MREEQGRPCVFFTSAMTPDDLQLQLRTWRIRIREMKDVADVKPRLLDILNKIRFALLSVPSSLHHTSNAPAGDGGMRLPC